MRPKDKETIRQLVVQGCSNQEIANRVRRLDLVGREMYYYIEKFRDTLSRERQKDATWRLAKTEPYWEDELEYGAEFKMRGSLSVSETMILNELNKGEAFIDVRPRSVIWTRYIRKTRPALERIIDRSL